MKDYPPVPSSIGQSFFEIPNAHIFDKLDGSSCRSEWSKKKGWHKHGKRNGLIDDSNPHLTVVPKLFMDRYAGPLERLAHDSRWQHLVVFYEFWGKKSIAGLHFAGDPKYLTIFDAAPDKKGIMDPLDFRRAFEAVVPTARWLGQVNWTRGLVARIRAGEWDDLGITFEGVVAKGGSRHKLVRSKAKTQKWIDRVIEVHGEMAGRKLIES